MKTRPSKTKCFIWMYIPEMWSGRTWRSFAQTKIIQRQAIKHWLRCQDIPRIQKLSYARTIKKRWLRTKAGTRDVSVSREYTTIKRWWNMISDSCFKNYVIRKSPPYGIFWPQPGLRPNDDMSALEMARNFEKKFLGNHIIKMNSKTLRELRSIAKG